MPEVPTQITDSLNQLELEANSTQRYSGGRPLAMDEPTFSHFPRLRNLPRNVPPSDEDRLHLLDQERNEVLSSNDPDAQLAWAQSALAFVEVTIFYQERESEPRPRPPTPGPEHSLKEDAMSVVQFLAEQEHPFALFIVGNWFEFGKLGYREDKKEAFRCYSVAAEKGYARADYRIGMAFENSNDHQNAIKHYKEGAAANDSASNYVSGNLKIGVTRAHKDAETRNDDPSGSTRAEARLCPRRSLHSPGCARCGRECPSGRLCESHSKLIIYPR